MPPALSDDNESSGDEQIPAQKKGRRPNAQAELVEDEDEVDEENQEDSVEDEYIVEKVLGHRIRKGELEYHVKWQGYDDPADHTWEPEQNMDGAVDVLKEYFDHLGGRPEIKGQKRKGRPSAAKSESGTPASSAKRAKQEKQWSPPPGSWEHDVSHIDTVEESLDPKTGEAARFAYLVWNNQKKTQHPLKHVYVKCPQKMLQYYESHLVFTQNNDGLNGDDDDI
ncbi:chromo-domain-containing protein [Cucurbitaria berberidis CBS 394.84]|uniref:Chromo-domain-containing protein n=1 Tax=Cucurbitaria berberidis CBS 394.84 TaxID=1168544 RepID=A0A9P4LCV1_9PLEO|nr:chromo-domain-containing protein [Cucurbitaria berberidis CBS 394.84]KAF1850400.1 chromo-domain-containing protein [Cucurbitaria berberidis CBS 394.84]